jgi:hypothetical protein
MTVAKLMPNNYLKAFMLLIFSFIAGMLAFQIRRQMLVEIASRYRWSERARKQKTCWVSSPKHRSFHALFACCSSEADSGQ